MAVNLSMLAGAGAQFFDNSGVILSGGKLYTYAAGTTTPQATYTTSAGNVAHTNPIVLNSAGRVASGGEIWLTDAVAYKFVLETSTAITIATYDDVTGNGSGIFALFAAPSGSSFVGFLQAGTGAVATTVQGKLRESVSVKDFGAVGNGVTDDTAAIRNAVAMGGYIEFPDSTATYLLTGFVDITNPTHIDLGGSTVNFVLATQQAGFHIKSDNVTIENGTITVVGSVMGGNGHSLNCVTAGNQGTGAGYKNLTIRNLTASTNRNDAGATIGIIGECSNVLIENIAVPDNANCRNVIGIEWGGLPVPGGTGHPHDIVVRNIKIGKLTFPSYGSAGYVYGVWISAAFNVKVENLSMEQGYGLVMVTRGDNANTYAPADYKDMVGHGISVENAIIQSCYGFGIRTIGSYKNITLNNIDCDAAFKNIRVIGGKIGANNNFGSAFEQCKNVKIDGFTVSGTTAAGVTTGVDVENLDIRNVDISGCELYAISLSNGAVCPSISHGLFVGNNSLGGSGTSTSVISIDNATDASVEHCNFSTPGAVSETQKYCVFATANAVRPRLNNNHVYAVAASGIGYLINASTTPNIDANGLNNTGASGITNIVGGAPIFIFQGNNQKMSRGSAVPTAGTWAVGDIIWRITPIAGNFIGWVCTTAGTPGTWKTFGVISA